MYCFKFLLIFPQVLDSSTVEIAELAEISWIISKWLELKLYGCKVEKIYEDSLDSIPSPSPSVKIQIIGGKVYLRW